MNRKFLVGLLFVSLFSGGCAIFGGLHNGNNTPDSVPPAAYNRAVLEEGILQHPDDCLGVFKKYPDETRVLGDELVDFLTGDSPGAAIRAGRYADAKKNEEIKESKKQIVAITADCQVWKKQAEAANKAASQKDGELVNLRLEKSAQVLEIAGLKQKIADLSKPKPSQVVPAAAVENIVQIPRQPVSIFNNRHKCTLTLRIMRDEVIVDIPPQTSSTANLLPGSYNLGFSCKVHTDFHDSRDIYVADRPQQLIFP